MNKISRYINLTLQTSILRIHTFQWTSIQAEKKCKKELQQRSALGIIRVHLEGHEARARPRSPSICLFAWFQSVLLTCLNAHQEGRDEKRNQPCCWLRAYGSNSCFTTNEWCGSAGDLSSPSPSFWCEEYRKWALWATHWVWLHSPGRSSPCRWHVIMWN